MSTNRFSAYSFADKPSVPALPSGFAICQFTGQSNSLALQLMAQQQAYAAALIAAREEALRVVLSRLQVSPN